MSTTTKNTMTAIRSIRPIRPATRTGLRFVGRYLQLLVAGVVGMAVLGSLPLRFGVTSVEVLALLMGTSMIAGMMPVMVWRRHSWRAIAELGVALHLAFAVLFPAYWAGVLSVEGLMIVGHVLMLPAMAVAMIRRRDEYTGAR
jgi:flagellar biosynthetic protein FliP